MYLPIFVLHASPFIYLSFSAAWFDDNNRVLATSGAPAL